MAVISGRITIDSSPDLRTLLLQRLAMPDCESLTADLTNVDYVDTSALAVLLEVLKSAHNLNKRFRLGGLRGHPRYLLETTHILQLFNEDANGQAA
ncbi:MAG: STAS domain-containing protein [Acidobacteriaceae bacterium]|nr:STAS domain-containing protein [Acidobacteriaceae bacterium]MBV8570839.1 STAS domain-containing protein [Acidobacteriaceae bacterium]